VSIEISANQLLFRKIVKIALVCLVVISLFVFWPKDTIEVKTVRVTRKNVEEIIHSLQAGVVKSKRQTSLRSVSTGRVENLHVKRGDRVLEGQLLVELENKTQTARSRLAKANQASGESSYRAAKLRQEMAQKAFERSSKLKEKGAVSNQALERVKNELDVAKEAVAASYSNLSQLKASVDLAQAALDDTRIKSPFAGLLVALHVEIGESIISGAPIADLVDDSSISIKASVDEADTGRLEIGMPVKIECDSYPNKTLKGSLIWIAPVVQKDARQNRRVEVEIGIDKTAEQLKIGMSADIEILVSEKKNVLAIPTNTIMRKGGLEQVYVVEGNNASLRKIRTGLSNWEITEITEGLYEGDHVISSLDKKELEDGVRVKVQGANSSNKIAY
jgi:RND family efflux transporter MFP subunit